MICFTWINPLFNKIGAQKMFIDYKRYKIPVITNEFRKNGFLYRGMAYNLTILEVTRDNEPTIVGYTKIDKYSITTIDRRKIKSWLPLVIRKEPREKLAYVDSVASDYSWFVDRSGVAHDGFNFFIPCYRYALRQAAVETGLSLDRTLVEELFNPIDTELLRIACCIRNGKPLTFYQQAREF